MSSRYLDQLKLEPFSNWYIGINSGSTLTACANCNCIAIAMSDCAANPKIWLDDRLQSD